MSYFDSDRSGEFNFGGPRSTAAIRGICIHTTEGTRSADANAGTADSVTTYQINSQSGSYHVMVGVDGKRIRQNTDDWVTWSTGNQGNDILLHVCLVGAAAQTRAEWLAQDRMLRGVASVVRYWSDQYRIPLRRVSAAGLPGILGHIDTRVWGGTDHTDPGVNFPYDRVIELAKSGGAPTPKDDMTPDQERTLNNVARQLGPWPQLGKNAKGEDLTLVDAVAYILHQLGPWPQLGTDDQGRPLTPVDALAALRADVDHLLESNK